MLTGRPIWQIGAAGVLYGTLPKEFPVFPLRLTTAGYDTRFTGKGSGEIESVRYSPEEKAVHINKAQAFTPVPQEVWDFHIGGYQVIEKYLKSRKGRMLSLDEIDHVGHVADALAFTIRQMAEIDAAYAQAFPGRIDNDAA